MTKKIKIIIPIGVVFLFLIVGGIFYLQQGKSLLRFNPLGAAVGFLSQFGNKETDALKLLLEETRSELEKLREEISLLEEKLETEQETRAELELKYDSEMTTLAAKFDSLVKIVDNFGQQMNAISQTKELKEKNIEEEMEEELEPEINQEITLCQKREGDFPKRNKVIFNEISWMGTEVSSSDEWVELKNISGTEISLAGWQILDKDGQIKIIFSSGERFSAGGFYLLERTDDDSVPNIPADKIYTGALNDTNEALYLFNKNCELEDEVLANPDWPAGDKNSKRTMERKSDLSWQTSENPAGTPKRENSSGYYVYYGGGGGGATSTPTYCSQENLSSPTHQPIIINEVAWMGTSSTNWRNEWIELKNISTNSISLVGWQLLDKDQDIKIVFENQDLIEASGFYLLEWKDDTTISHIQADKIYTGNLKDTEESLRLFNQNCNLIDEIITDPNWPAGNKDERRSMERKADLNWQTYFGDGENGIFGTPKKENSQKPEQKDEISPSVSFVSLSPLQTTLSFSLSFEITDSAVETVTPSGLDGFTFRWKEEGENWQEDMYQKIEGAPLIFAGEKTFTGEDEKTYYFQIKAKDVAGNESNWLPEPLASTKISLPKTIIISEVQYNPPQSGVDKACEWFELYNPNNSSINLINWTVTDNTETDTIPELIIPPQGFAVVAATSTGFLTNYPDFSGTIVYILDGDVGNGLANSGDRIILKRGEGVEVDAVSWGTDNYAFEGANLLITEDGKSIARVSKEIDTNSASDWQILDLPNPGQ